MTPERFKPLVLDALLESLPSGKFDRTRFKLFNPARWIADSVKINCDHDGFLDDAAIADTLRELSDFQPQIFD